MEDSSILIFSSEQGNALAEALQGGLIGFCRARLWKEEQKQNLATEVLDSLVATAKSYDFAILLLATVDDKPGSPGDELQAEKSRGSLLFEYGLLIGILGLERCFLAADESVVLGRLPEDLKGVNALKFKELPDSTPDQRKAAITNIIGTIKDNIQKVGPRKKRTTTLELISLQQVLDREKPKPVGRLTTNAGNVVLASLQPGELEYKPAEQVRANMDMGIDYVYFFPGTIDGAGKITQLLQMLLLRGRIKPEAALNKLSRKVAIREHRTEVLDDLREICEARSLRIYFLPHEPALQFCIHNANDVDEAVAYQKYNRDDYVQLHMDTRQAHRLWCDLQINIPTITEKRGIFHSTMCFDIEERRDIKTALHREIETCFPKIWADVASYCFEGRPKAEQE